MATVTIGGNDYFSYSSVADALDYFLASTKYDTWVSYTSDEQARGLVSATRYLDRKNWQGEKTDELQEGDFPRTGLTDCGGNTVTSVESLVLATEATQLLAFYMLDSDTFEEDSGKPSNIKRLKADTAEIEYFNFGFDTVTQLPGPVMDLLGCFLSTAASATTGVYVSGTDGTILDDDFGVNLP